jgi:hypothetical protein
MTFETAAGLAADALRQGKGDTMLFESFDNTGYRSFERRMMAQVHPRTLGPMDTWQAVEYLQRKGIIRGYILFRYDRNDRPWHGAGAIDESANVATALAPILGGIAVSEKFEPKAKALGLPLLLDARDKTEAWCLEQYGDQFSTTVLTTAEPKARNIRSLAVALRSFVLSQPGPTYEAALARCKPDCPVLGWGCGGEDQQTLPSSQWGLFQTATNWCHNLPPFCTEDPVTSFPPGTLSSPHAGLSWGDLRWESGVHYATFLMSDGDNVQWLMGNFLGGSEGRSYYESPARGSFPMGWTFPYVDLAQLCPYTLMDLFTRATPNDDFVLHGGGGYIYPDRFGEARPADHALALHARRFGEYLRFGGLRALAMNLLEWDSPSARDAYDTYVSQIPSLAGLLTVQYYPYSGGEGRILWAHDGDRELPVVSCAYTIWAQTGRPRDATPAAVAAAINASPRGGATWTDANFTYVMPHAWSRFRDTHGDPSLTAEEVGVDQNLETPDTERGLMPVKWAVDRLQPDVRVVLPTEFLLQVRLHLRTRQALTEFAQELAPQVAASRSRRAAELYAQATRLLPTVHDGDDSGRDCFNLLRRTHRLLTPPARR